MVRAELTRTMYVLEIPADDGTFDILQSADRPAMYGELRTTYGERWPIDQTALDQAFRYLSANLRQMDVHFGRSFALSVR